MKKKNTPDTKTYILKYPVYNHIDFPAGTIVKLLQGEHYNFIVSEGKLAGEKGCVADGLNGWLIDNTVANRRLFKIFKNEEKRMENDMAALNKKWSAMPTSKIES